MAMSKKLGAEFIGFLDQARNAARARIQAGQDNLVIEEAQNQFNVSVELLGVDELEAAGVFFQTVADQIGGDFTEMANIASEFGTGSQQFMEAVREFANANPQLQITVGSGGGSAPPPATGGPPADQPIDFQPYNPDPFTQIFVPIYSGSQGNF